MKAEKIAEEIRKEADRLRSILISALYKADRLETLATIRNFSQSTGELIEELETDLKECYNTILEIGAYYNILLDFKEGDA